MKKIRNYKRLINDIINSPTPFRVEIIGYASYGKDIYPLLEATFLSKTAKKNIVILGCHHGDESFTTHILLKWMQKYIPTLHPDFNIFIYPCVNPSGYELGCRDNAAKQDTNDDRFFYKNSKVQELAILFDAFPSSPDLIIDVHADTGKTNSYMYEHKSESLETIAEKVMQDTDIYIPYLRTKTIYKCPVKNGVITPPSCDIGVEGALERLGTDYTLTVELPGKFDGQKRAVGGIAILTSILTHYKLIVDKEIVQEKK